MDRITAKILKKFAQYDEYLQADSLEEEGLKDNIFERFIITVFGGAM